MGNPRPLALLITVAVVWIGVVSAHCPHDNLLRCFIRSPTLAITFCSWTAGIYPTASTIYATTTWLPPPEPTPETSSSEPPSCHSSVIPTTPSITVTITTTETYVSTTLSTAVSTTVSTATSTIVNTAVSTFVSTEVSTVTITVAPPPTPNAPTSAPEPSSTLATSSGSDTDSTSSSSTFTAPSSSVDDGDDNLSPPPPPPPSITPWSPPGDPWETTPSRRTTGPITTLLSAAIQGRTEPKTSLACLDNLEPDAEDITSACSCFSSGYSIEPVTSTVTAYPGPTCPGGQPTFPNCFDDFHPYNCGTDQYGVVACSCALTTEDTAECTLGDYERDNACSTSDDCNDGWFCTLIDCFDDDVYSVCTKACPRRFAVSGAGAGRFMIEAPMQRNLSILIEGYEAP